MDEYKISQKQLTEQQRERITRNFRAAKAIRDRKRSQLYNTPPSPVNIWPNHPGPDRMSLDGCSSLGSDFRSPPTSRFRKKTHIELNTGEIQRNALSDLNTNTPIRLGTPQNVKGLSHVGTPTMLEKSHSHSEYSFAKHPSNGICPEAKAQVNVTPAVVTFTEGFNDDFDEILLQEIDALCGQRSKTEDAILHPTSETPSDEKVVSRENPTLLVEGVLGTDLSRPASASIRYKEEKILGFLSAIFQSPGDPKLEDSSLLSPLAAHAETFENEAAAGTCQITAPNAIVRTPKRLDERGNTQSLVRRAGDADGVKSVKMSCSPASLRLNPSQPATRCDPPETAAVFSVSSLSGVKSLRELSSIAESSIRARGVGLASDALIQQAGSECLQKLNLSQRQEATSTDLPKAEAILSASNASRSELLTRCSSLCVNTTLASEVGLSPAALSDERIPVYLQNLNLSQKEAAVSDITRPLLILAGPGSGKTSTMVARLIHLLEEGTEPKSILAMTFTTAAATEMRERIGAAIGKIKSKELAISTFHSCCLQLCRTHADKLGRTPEFLVYGSGQQRKAVIEATRIALCENKGSPLAGESIVKDLPDRDSESMSPSLWREQARKWQQFVTQAKCAGRTSAYYEKIDNVLAASVLKNYEKTLAACNALDYHDFITYAVTLLEGNQAVLEECQKTWCCILVDEFQDTSSMQYKFLRLLASHQRITVVGDDDQSIFGFNGANAAGFFSFRKDFPNLNEVRLHQNYRSTRCIVEAASALIKNNNKRCQTEQVVTDNILGDRIEVRECRNESAQCAFVADAILMATSSKKNSGYGSTAVLYRRQVSGKLFQSTFRARKIPFNVHGVAFYRKKIIKNIIAVFWTVLPGRKDVFSRRAFKALYGGEKSETKKAVEYVEKISRSKNCHFLQAASEIFTAKVSGTFTRRQLALGKKVLGTINTVKHLVSKEQSLSAIISAVVNLLPQRPIMDTRAVVTEDGRRLLNEDEDSRTVLEYLLDDVNEYLGKHYTFEAEPARDAAMKGGGCSTVLRAFLDYMTAREEENFRSRREENTNSVTLTTMHQSKGLEWDTVFIVKANDTEIPLVHEGMGCVNEGSISLEEERRLFYVAITRARKKLYLSYIVVDSDRQILRPTRFLGELPHHLLDFQDGVNQVKESIMTEKDGLQTKDGHRRTGTILDARIDYVDSVSTGKGPVHNSKGLDVKDEELGNDGAQADGDESSGAAAVGSCLRTSAFLKGFSVEARSVVASLFHSWAKKPSFQDPKRLLSKVGFVIDERLRSKGTKNKEVLISLKLALRDEAALPYAQNVLAWEKLPAEERAVLQAERQEHFQMQNSERSSAAAAATPKQISYLRSLGCTVDPSSRLHASRLIEQYKKL